MYLINLSVCRCSSFFVRINLSKIFESLDSKKKPEHILKSHYKFPNEAQSLVGQDILSNLRAFWRESTYLRCEEKMFRYLNTFGK